MEFGKYDGVRSAKELISVGIPFVLLSLLFYQIRKKQLNFKVINLKVSDEEFAKAMKDSASELEWEFEKKTKNYIRAFRGPDILGSEMITIIREKDRILFNCIPNPDHKASIFTFGLKKVHVETFTRILIEKQDKKTTALRKEQIEKWTLFDYVLRIVGYSFCLLFIGLSIFLFFPEGDIFIGILSATTGLTIIANDLKKIWEKTVNR